MKNTKIVLIEDDPSIIEMYQLRFSEAGLDISIATDGEEGLVLIKKVKPKIVLLDIMIPKMDGFAVLSEMKNQADLKDIIVLLLTNLGQDSDIEKGKNLGATDYVVKSSLTPTQVLEKIKEFIK